jgi:hypothetical protein
MPCRNKTSLFHEEQRKNKKQRLAAQREIEREKITANG